MPIFPHKPSPPLRLISYDSTSSSKTITYLWRPMIFSFRCHFSCTADLEKFNLKKFKIFFLEGVERNLEGWVFFGLFVSLMMGLWVGDWVEQVWGWRGWGSEVGALWWYFTELQSLTGLEKHELIAQFQMFRNVLNKLRYWVFSPITQVWESKLEKCQVNSMVYTHLCFGRLCARYLLFISDWTQRIRLRNPQSVNFQ